MTMHIASNQTRRQFAGMSKTDPAVRIPRQLHAFLKAWLGDWQSSAPMHVVSWAERDRPGWDGGTIPALGIETPAGTTLSLSPTRFPSGTAVDPVQLLAAMRAPGADRTVPMLLGRSDFIFGRAIFRWAEAIPPLPEIGHWVDANDPRLPGWLRPFNGDVLVAWDDHGRYAAGVGRKQHNPFGHELAVSTAPGHRGKGLARKLVAQAARQVIADGAVPIYLHAPGNIASARVAEAAGFPDRGWRLIEVG
jgi:GNAT superfamily N-acetyltransferase